MLNEYKSRCRHCGGFDGTIEYEDEFGIRMAIRNHEPFSNQCLSQGFSKNMTVYEPSDNLEWVQWYNEQNQKATA